MPMPLLGPSDIGSLIQEPSEVSITPNSGPPGSSVAAQLLAGDSFSVQSRVGLNYSGATNYLWKVPVPDVEFIDAANLKFTIPDNAGCGSYDVVITTPASARFTSDSWSRPVAFNVVSTHHRRQRCVRVPSIRSLTPNPASPSDPITVDGDHFAPDSTIAILRRAPSTPLKVLTVPSRVESSRRLEFDLPSFDDLCGWVFDIAVVNPNIMPASNLVQLALGSQHRLQVLSYNVQLIMPIVVDTAIRVGGCVAACWDQKSRAEVLRTHPIMRGQDVVVLQEAFLYVRDIYLDALSMLPSLVSMAGIHLLGSLEAPAYAPSLIRALRDEYPHERALSPAPYSVDGKLKGADGGVVIMSRWPIVDDDELFFKACDGVDCLAAKGVLYAALEKSGQIYHVFGTHLNAGSDEHARQARRRQLEQTAEFIVSRNIPSDQAVILAGDFNVNMRGDPDAYADMLDLLNVKHPCVTGRPATSNDTGDFLDYIFFTHDHLQPVWALNDVQTATDATEPRHLSDHNPVVGLFGFGSSDEGVVR